MLQSELQIILNKILADFNLLVFIIFGVLLWILIWYLVARINYFKSIKAHRSDAIKRSKSVILWEVTEKIVPIIPTCPYNPKDMTFLGKGVDYIVFDWLSEWYLKKIIFVEVKTWKSRLNKNEKQIMNTIIRNKVEYQEWRI